MVSSGRLRGGSSVVLGLSCLGLVAGATGCGGKGGGASDAATAAALRFLSTPVHSAAVGGLMQYQAALSAPGDAQWILAQSPHGATIQPGGQVTWTPDDASAGDQAFQIIASVGGDMVQQSFQVTAASAIMQESAHVDPSNPNGASVVVDQPLSPVRGAAVQIDPGALPPGPPIDVSLSSMQHPPVPPDVMMVAGVDPHDVQPVELHPTGVTFVKPVRLQLPINGSLRALANLTVKTYDYQQGKWQKVTVTKVDPTAGVIVAEVKHFSPYVVTPDVKLLDLSAAVGPAACATALVVQAKLVPAFSAVPAAAVNGWSGAGAGASSTVADVLAALPAGQALQVYTRVAARALAGTGAQSGWLLASATKQADGKLVVGVASDSHAGGFLAVPTTGLSATDPELLGWLNGSRADLVFGALGGLAGGVAVSGDVSLYVVAAPDAARPPPASANAVASDEVDVTTLAAATGDADCDGALDAWDADPHGAAPPILAGAPGSPVHVSVGSPLSLAVSSPQPGVTFAWSASDPLVTLAPAGATAKATPTVAGLFTVTVAGTLAGATSQLSWTVIADPPAVAAAAMAPTVALAASAIVVRVGEPVTLTALGKDPRGAALSYAWSGGDATTLSATTGDTIVFKGGAPGDYVVTCVASDGAASSTPASVTLTVLSATANRPPGVPSVTPLSSVLTHMPGQGVSVSLSATAFDPDGDALTFAFAADASTPSSFTLATSGATATFSTTQDGSYLFYVTATDAKGAVGPWTPVKIIVLPPLGANPVDADGDGYPAGFDCNDMDKTIHPGAKEICGDGIDQNCDGHDTLAQDCDADGDRFTPAQHDCDDNDPARNPGAVERCDGVDNNCDGIVDEGFDKGVACTNGVGACAVASTTQCSATYVSVVCGGTPGQPTVEVCNGKDDDCDGIVDDVAGAATATGDVANCGGCAIACAAPASSVPACVMGGCQSTCKPGFVDADRDPTNGCECQLTNGGVEICDGLDNDCDGVPDDGITATFYPGDPTTLGKGACSAGVQRCVGGALVVVKPATVPAPEICNGFDDNCDGQVDEGFDLKTDSKNCGACGVVCAGGVACQGGTCPGGTAPPDGGVVMMGGDGGVTMRGDGGAGPASNLGLCKDATGATICVDLFVDQGNCGACGHPCETGQFCTNGVCMIPAPITCPSTNLTCADAASGGKAYCTDPTIDARNCGQCGNVCASGMCVGGNCAAATASTSRDAAATTAFDAGTAALAADGGAGCPASAPATCTNAVGTVCTDVMTDPANCGVCGKVCGANQACMDGTCLTATSTATCGGAFTMCPTGCTSLADDPRNCMACGMFCDGTCSAGACVFAGGAGAFGATCGANTDCGGGLCMDQARFGWPGGFCTSLCDPNLPCPANQLCVGSATSGALGTCRQMCAADADCGAVRSGYLCSNGACAPSCLQGGACGAGQMCDATGHCVAAVPTCAASQMLCPTPDGTSMYCADVSKDQVNCGGCGKICPASMTCNNGVCGGQVICPTSLTTCDSAQRGSYCADVTRDPSNCGACGATCAVNAICTAGKCQGGGGTYYGLAVCAPAGGGALCTNLLDDPNNCGACGAACPPPQGCYSGVCATTPPQVTCSATTRPCLDASGQKMYCSDPSSDPGNCGACGVVCASGGCVNGSCTGVATSADAGTALACAGSATSFPCNDPTTGKPFCANLLFDNANCMSCGHACAASSSCQNGACVPSATFDASAPTDASTITCDPPTSPCDGTYCADLSSDSTNCGACHKLCPGGYACYMGNCIAP